MIPIFVAKYTHISGRWVANHRQCRQLQYLPYVRMVHGKVQYSTVYDLGPGSSMTSFRHDVAYITPAYYEPTTVLAVLHLIPCLTHGSL